MHDKFISLKKIEEWLEDLDKKPSEIEVTLLIDVIKTVTECEMREIKESGLALQKKVLELAGFSPTSAAMALVDDLIAAPMEIDEEADELIEDITKGGNGPPYMPKNCADCRNARVIYQMGIYSLQCWHDGDNKDPKIIIAADPKAAFHQPASMTKQQLFDRAKGPPPDWCPLRIPPPQSPSPA